MDTPTLLALAVAAGILIFFYGLRRTLLSDVDVETRLGSYDLPELRGLRERGRHPLVNSVDEALEGRSFADNLARDLSRANLKLTVAEFLGIQVGLGLVILVVGLVAGLPFPVPLLLPVLAFVVPRWYLRYLHRRRLDAFNSQLGDTLSMLANALRSGYSLLQSMEVVARDAPEPTKEEFLRVAREVSLGLSPQEALGNVVRRMNSDDFDLVVTAINVQHEVGGNLAQILDTIGHTIRERIRIQGEIRVITAQQTLSGYVISALPLVISGILFVMNPAYMSEMFTPGPFLALPICAGTGIVLGFLIMRKITQIEV